MSKNKPLTFQAKQNLDFVTLITQALSGKVVINDSMTLTTKGEVNVRVSPVSGGFKVDFLSPEPVASITKFITISDVVDYVIFTHDKKLRLKVRTWPAEISIEMPKT